MNEVEEDEEFGSKNQKDRENKLANGRIGGTVTRRQ